MWIVLWRARRRRQAVDASTAVAQSGRRSALGFRSSLQLAAENQDLRERKGMTLVPTRMYFSNGHVKVTLSLAKGKKAHDKRETIKKRETDRETRAAVKERRNS